MGPKGYPQARTQEARALERRRAKRVAKRLLKYACPFAVSDYERALNWYATARREIQRVYGEDWMIACGVIAATSPQVDVRMNGTLARAVIAHWREGTLKQWTPWLPCHRKNVHRALKGAPLSGQKVEAFRLALLGHDEIVVDTWMLRAAGAPSKAIHSGSPSWVRVTHEAIRLVALKLGWKQSETQAVIWSAYREQNWNSKKGVGTGALEV